MAVGAWWQSILAWRAARRPVLSPDDFLAEMLARCQREHPHATVEIDAGTPLALRFAANDGGEAKQIALQDLYDHCRTSTQLDGLAAKAAVLAQLVERGPPGPGDLRLMIVATSFVATIPPADAKTLVMEDIAEGLTLMLVLDTDMRKGPVSLEDLDDFGLDRAEAWARGLREVTARMPPLPTAHQLREAQRTGTPFTFDIQPYLTAMMIDRTAWAALAAEVGPGLAVVPVCDQILLVTIAPDGRQLKKFKKAAVQDCAVLEELCITSDVYRLREDSWVLAR